jgi:hypothetical protein
MKRRDEREADQRDGAAENAINAILPAAAMNFQKLIQAFWRIFLHCLRIVWSRLPARQGPQARCPQLQCA